MEILQDGDGYRAVVCGKHYVGQTREGVLTAVRHHHSVNIPQPVEVKPAPRPHDILRHAEKFEDKYRAKGELIGLAGQGDSEAQGLVRQLEKNKADGLRLASEAAQEVGRPHAYAHQILAESKKLAGAGDFANLTHSEITARVQDLIMRNALMRLLVKLYEVR